jgi:hypothetical protein|nr:MAG TPA: hypothetical protein [Caudoviricetes sp.]
MGKTKPREVCRFTGFFIQPLMQKERTLPKYSKTRVEIHPKEGMKVETYASPFMRVCIGIALLIVALGFALSLTAPFVQAIGQLLMVLSG